MNQGLDFEGKAQALAYRPSMAYVYEDVGWEYKRLTRDLAHEDLPTEQELNTLGQPAG